VRRVPLVVILALTLLASCSPQNEDVQELKGFLARSELAPRVFDYRALGPTDEFEVHGEVADDLRYKMVLSHEGRRLVQYVVSDDALAVRLADPAFGKKLANQLGHPTVDAALREGKWVVDPSGAPALFKKVAGQRGVSSGDPFQDTREAIRVITEYITQARAVKEWNLEDIEYRPQYDPWRYPNKEAQEVRYDLLRQPLPKSEAQTLGGQTGDAAQIGQFRKTSVFVWRNRVREICSVIDIDGHEDIRALRERGLRSNPFLANLLKVIQRKETSVPIEPRISIAEVGYPDEVAVGIPAGAVRGKLETFVSAFKQGVTAGALRPTRRMSIDECRRPPGETPG
jgi:hypothetical protein